MQLAYPANALMPSYMHSTALTHPGLVMQGGQYAGAGYAGHMVPHMVPRGYDIDGELLNHNPSRSDFRNIHHGHGHNMSQEKHKDMDASEHDGGCCCVIA